MSSVFCWLVYAWFGGLGRKSFSLLYMTIVTVNFFCFCNGPLRVIKISITKWINLFYNFLFCFLFYATHHVSRKSNQPKKSSCTKYIKKLQRKCKKNCLGLIKKSQIYLNWIVWRTLWRSQALLFTLWPVYHTFSMEIK